LNAKQLNFQDGRSSEISLVVDQRSKFQEKVSHNDFLQNGKLFFFLFSEILGDFFGANYNKINGFLNDKIHKIFNYLSLCHGMTLQRVGKLHKTECWLRE
jgi:hypothetical protein